MPSPRGPWWKTPSAITGRTSTTSAGGKGYETRQHHRIANEVVAKDEANPPGKRLEERIQRSVRASSQADLQEAHCNEKGKEEKGLHQQREADAGFGDGPSPDRRTRDPRKVVVQ